MRQRSHLIWGLLGASAIGYISWENHLSSERVAKMASRVEKLATKIIDPVPVAAMREIMVRAAPSEDTASVAPEPKATAVPVEAEPKGANTASAERTGEARRQADDIIRSGVITADGVRSLSSQLDTLPRADAFEIRRRIADAINKQELIPAELPFDMP